jgi:hypothetical protein
MSYVNLQLYAKGLPDKCFPSSFQSFVSLSFLFSQFQIPCISSDTLKRVYMPVDPLRRDAGCLLFPSVIEIFCDTVFWLYIMQNLLGKRLGWVRLIKNPLLF